MMRYFTVEQAQHLLPEIQRLLRRAREAQLRVEDEDTALDDLEQVLDEIRQHGAEVRDLDTGVVDFPTRYLGHDVALCYRLGEPAILHWHGAEEGLTGPRRIDRRFLENHAGGAVH